MYIDLPTTINIIKTYKNIHNKVMSGFYKKKKEENYNIQKFQI